MKTFTKIIIAAAALTAAAAAVSKHFCDFALGSGKNSFDVKCGFRKGDGDLSEKQQDLAKAMDERGRNFREWFAANAEDVNLLTNDGVKVHALLLKADEPSRKYAVLCHGYKDCAEEMGYQAYNFRKLGYNVLAVDGRASGSTQGKYIGMGWLERKDICGYINFITARDAQAEILLYGISMGAAEVMMAAGEHLPSNVKVIVEDCGYTSVWDEFKLQLTDIFHIPPFPVLNIVSLYCKLVHGFGFKEASAVDALRRSNIPILMIHGTEDKFVPFSMLDELYEAAAGDKEKLAVEGAGHIQSSAVAPDLYWGKIREFADKYIR
ncbi:MAG: alpha/beta hydrolase [Oscillospiraceae bacterium]